MRFSHLESIATTDQGFKRKRNEDTFVAIHDVGLFCVADGMGGVSGGDIASRCIRDTVTQIFQTADKQAVASFRGRTNLYEQAVEIASRWIKHYAEERGIQDMGSTVLALLFDQRDVRRALAMHAGDSRLYRVRDNALTQITRDHTVAAALGRSEQSLPVGFRNRLTKAVGLAETTEIEKTAVEVRSGDLYLLCSDGLSRMVSERQLLKTLRQGLTGDLKALGEELIHQANAAGGDDNITIILVRVGLLDGLEVEQGNDPETKTPETACEAPTMIPESPVALVVQPVQRATDTDTIEGITPCTPATPQTPSEVPVAVTLEPLVEPTLAPPPNYVPRSQHVTPMEMDKLAAPFKPTTRDRRQTPNVVQGSATTPKALLDFKFKSAISFVVVGLIIGIGGIIIFKQPKTQTVVSTVTVKPPPLPIASTTNADPVRIPSVILPPKKPLTNLPPSLTSKVKPPAEMPISNVVVAASGNATTTNRPTPSTTIVVVKPPEPTGDMTVATSRVSPMMTNSVVSAVKANEYVVAKPREEKSTLSRNAQAQQRAEEQVQFLKAFPNEVVLTIKSGRWGKLATRVEGQKLTEDQLRKSDTDSYMIYTTWLKTWRLASTNVAMAQLELQQFTDHLGKLYDWLGRAPTQEKFVVIPGQIKQTDDLCRKLSAVQADLLSLTTQYAERVQAENKVWGTKAKRLYGLWAFMDKDVKPSAEVVHALDRMDENMRAVRRRTDLSKTPISMKKAQEVFVLLDETQRNRLVVWRAVQQRIRTLHRPGPWDARGDPQTDARLSDMRAKLYPLQNIFDLSGESWSRQADVSVVQDVLDAVSKIIATPLADEKAAHQE